jgi:hypothetical protein
MNVERHPATDRRTTSDLIELADATLNCARRASREQVRTARRLYARALVRLGVDAPASLGVRQLSVLARSELHRARPSLRSRLRQLRAGSRPTHAVIALGLMALVVALAFRRTPPNLLLRGDRWYASSSQCTPKAGKCGGTPTKILFSTVDEEHPFVRIDLETSMLVSHLRVENRSDSAVQERAVPLVALGSVDGDDWFELGRRTVWFQTWDLRFDRRHVRYLELLVPRRSALQLESVQLF